MYMADQEKRAVPQEGPSFVEREAETLRDGAFVVGVGAIVIAAVAESPKLAVLGLATTAAGLAYEGLRRFMHHHRTNETIPSE